MADLAALLSEVDDLPADERQIFIMGMIIQLAQAVTDIQGTLDAHTQMLGKICRQVGVPKQELLDAAKAASDG